MSENKTQTDEKVPTTDVMLHYLRNYGANARILVVNANSATRDYFLDFGEGILTKGHKEISSVRPKDQITHKLGGVIKLVTADRVATKVMAGQMFGMIVIETVPDIDEFTREEVKFLLRLEPYRFIESLDGFVMKETEVGK